MIARRDVAAKGKKNQNDDGVDKAEKERLLGSQEGWGKGERSSKQAWVIIQCERRLSIRFDREISEVAGQE